MKKTISRQIASLSLSGKTLLSLLLLTVWKIGGLAAQVSISGMTADYPSKRISFTVTWTSQPYNNQIWVIADYVRIENNAAAGSWSRAPLLGITVSGSGTAATVTGDSGFILNTTGSSGSARVTAMTNIRAEITQFNWCAHAFHYPPAATVNAAGGYDLHGTPPFTVNGVKLADGVTAFAAGTCITSLSDVTGNPSFVVPAVPALGSPNSPVICSGRPAALSVAATGGTTTAMTYTWTVNGASATTTASDYATGALTASATWSVQATNANNCKSNTAGGSITVNRSAGRNETPDATCGCTAGLVDCDRSCQPDCGPNMASWWNCSVTQISSVQYEGRGQTWNNAVQTCRNKGQDWRLPTQTELQCICRNKGNVPGGYTANGYWSQTKDRYGDVYTIDYTCLQRALNPGLATYVKCVR